MIDALSTAQTLPYSTGLYEKSVVNSVRISHPAEQVRREHPSHDTAYASLMESDVPIVVQHARIDTRQADVGSHG